MAEILGATVLEHVILAGVPGALLTVLFGALVWVRLDTVWSEERWTDWLSLGALGVGAGVCTGLLHFGVMPTAGTMEPAVLVAVVASLGWWAQKRGWQYWSLDRER